MDHNFSSKLAALNVKSLQILRNKFENLVVPLACVVDYYGIRFEVQSFVSISSNSLVYGSDNEGLTFNQLEAVDLAKEIGSKLNLKPHVFRT